MPITQNTYERVSLEITEYAEELILFAIRQQRAISNRLIRNPNTSINERSELERMQRRWASFIEDAEDWMDTELAEMYKRGLVSGGTAGVTAGAFAVSGLLIPNVSSQPISAKAAQILADFPEHHTMYGVFKQAADNSLRATRLPVVRQQQDRIRQIVIQASDSAYQTADTLTRRQLTQDLINQFQREGFTGIRYSNGRRVQLDSYAEMVARTQAQQASNQARWNRLQERGKDLTVISVHFPSSDICEPHQGRVHSISGDDPRYPSLESIISEGVFRPNCGHSSSEWNEGDELPERDISTEENREMNKAKQKQRYNERGIKSWKRRESGAVTESERNKARAKVREWQQKQRDHLEENEFLRRSYHREQI
jgi:hypothetical protein